jgi:hypothetical protein
MPKAKKQKIDNNCNCKGNKVNSCGGAVYGLGVIGAAIYYISVASGFWVGVLGILKAFVWPAFLVFELFKFLGA